MSDFNRVIHGMLVRTTHHPHTIVTVDDGHGKYIFSELPPGNFVRPLMECPAFIRKEMGDGYYPLMPQDLVNA